MKNAKSIEIKKQLVMEAYRKVKANKGSAGVDKVSILDFEQTLADNMYKIWNRMSSGSYVPPPVKLVEIPKTGGGKRPLGIPTVSDRVAQMVVVMTINPLIAPHFHENSYGYQENKSILDAVAKAKERCFDRHWVVDLDIKGFFDNIDHELLLKAIEKHVKSPWVIMYIKRWLTVPYQLADETIIQRNKGVPQGSVIGPVLSNLFLHYVFDEWMKREYPNIQFERYTDDIICHCLTLDQAEFMKKKIKSRLENCKLELSEAKTKIVYCKMKSRDKEYDVIQFDFLGYTFRPRAAINARGERFVAFSPAVSNTAKVKMGDTIRNWKRSQWVRMTIEEIAKQINPVIQGWINYYGKHNVTELKAFLDNINMKLANWVQNKFKGYKRHKSNAIYKLGDIAKANPTLFAHWAWGVMPPTSSQKRDRKVVDRIRRAV